MDAVMHEEPPQRGAALARRAHGREGDRPDGEIEIGRGRDDGGVVAAELKDRAGETGGEPRADGAAHGGRAGGRDDGDAGVVDERLADIAAADQDLGQAVGRIAEAAHRARDHRLRGQRRQRRLLGRLPDHRVAADQRERGIPGPHRHRKVESGDDPADAERMPGLHHPVVGALGRDGAAVELARQPDREVADVDHLLDLAEALRHDLARLDGHQPAEIVLGGAQFLREDAHELATPRRRDRAPGIEGLRGPAYGRARLLRAGDPDMGDDFARDRRRCRKSLARERALRHAEPGQDGERLVANRCAPGPGKRS